MATKDSGWSCTHSASVISETNSTATIRVTAYWTNSGWNYDIGAVYAWTYCDGNKQEVYSNGALNAPSNYASYSLGSYDYTVSKGTSKKSISCKAKITSNSSYVSGSKYSTAASVTISALPSYSVKYNANGGSGAPSSQTKWYKQDLTLSSTKPTRTGYSFAGWATSSTGSVAYQPGSTYTGNAALTLYAVWTANTYTVSYNTNGGSSAPSSQTKTYGVNLTLSSTKPTRTDYNFLGWSTSASGSAVYQPGGTYTNNSAVTLYAVWELAYVKPRITNFSAQRCNSAGIISEDGTYVKVSFDWATDNAVTSIRIQWKTQESDYWSPASVSSSGTSGSVSEVVGEGGISNETSYVFRAYVQDRDTDGTTYSPQIAIGTIKYPIDIKAEGAGIAFGKVAEKDNLMDVAFVTKLGGGLEYVILEAETNLDDVKIPNFYIGENVSTYNYTNCPLTSGTFYLEVVSIGEQGQVRQKITSCSKDNPVTFERFYFQDSWGTWHNASFGVSNVGVTGKNLNDYKTSGTYYFSSSYTPTNVPNDVVNGWLVVMALSSTTVKQLWYRGGTRGTNDFMIYVRTCISSTWSNWVCTSGYTKGDTINVGIATTGYLTNGASTVVFTVPLSKPIVGNPTISISSNKGFVLRHNGVYTHDTTSGGYVLPSKYGSFTVIPGGIVINADMSSTTNATSRDTIGLEWSGIITLS